MTAQLTFYRRWIWANAWSELLGLGTTLLLGFLLFSGLQDAGLVVTIGGAVFAVAAGACIEGGVVGYAQARVLEPAIPGLTGSRWIWATVIGAGVAWLLGMIPSTVVALTAAETEAATGSGPEGPMMFVLAAVMGLVLGPVLSAPQYVVLKAHVGRAGYWVVANALAWSAGMIAIFAGAGSLPLDAGGLRIAVTLAVCCLGAGAIVGLVHGPILAWLLARDGVFAHRR